MARRKDADDEPDDTPQGARRHVLLGTRWGRLTLRVGVLAVLLLGIGLVVGKARAQAYAVRENRLGPTSFVFEGLPAWADARISAMLHHQGLLQLDVSVFDPAAEERARGVLARHPLVRRVDDVRIVFPNKVRARVALREPGCWVQTHFVDRQGKPFCVLLSTDSHRIDERCYAGWLAQRRTPLPLLRGVDRAPLPVPGVPWDNLKEQVAEGLEAARVADRLARDLAWGRTRYVTYIDVSRFPSPGNRAMGEVLFTLSDGTTVDWGRTERDLAGSVEEEGYERKMARLMQALSGPPRPHVDVRFPAEPALPR
ncbi:MAG: cell division protein FtsQ/DivIB [Planctomycetia bacterium]